jgi:hypothetical protein
MSRRKRRLQRLRAETSPPAEPKSQEPEPPEPGREPSKPTSQKPDLGEFLKILARADPEQFARDLNDLFKRAGQDLNITPEEALLADFKFDGENLMVGLPQVPEVNITQLGALIAQNAPLLAQHRRPPITPERLRKEMEFFADEATRFMIEDHEHGTMLFPFLYGGPLAIIGLPDINLNDPQEGFYAAARMRVESFPEALEGFILIAQTWVVTTLLNEPHVVGPLRNHPQRQQSLIVAGAHVNGWRYTICVIFDENWRVAGRFTSDGQGFVIASDKIIDTLSRACFETDTEKLKRYIRAYEPRRENKRK